MRIGFLLFPGLTQLDLTGPYEVFARLPDAEIHLLWKNAEPVRTEHGLALIPTTILAACPTLDLLCVPGGPGVGGEAVDEAERLVRAILGKDTDLVTIERIVLPSDDRQRRSGSDRPKEACARNHTPESIPTIEVTGGDEGNGRVVVASRTDPGEQPPLPIVVQIHLYVVAGVNVRRPRQAVPFNVPGKSDMLVRRRRLGSGSRIHGRSQSSGEVEDVASQSTPTIYLQTLGPAWRCRPIQILLRIEYGTSAWQVELP